MDTPDRFVNCFRAIRRSVRQRLLEAHRRSILRAVHGGERLHLEGRIDLVHAQHLTLGRNVHIGAGAYFNCRGGIIIGDHTIISRRVTIYSYDHAFRHPTLLPYDDEIVPKPVRIGRYVWIGMNVSIAPGTVIEDGAVVGLGATVAGHIPAGAVVVTPKAQVVGHRDGAWSRRLAEQGMFRDMAA